MSKTLRVQSLISFLFGVAVATACAYFALRPQPVAAPVVAPTPELTDRQKLLLAQITTPECPETSGADDTVGYHVVNSCLYHDGARVFETSLLYQMVMGDFGARGIERAYFGMYADHPLASTEDWFWFSENGKTYVYFKVGGRSCMGCEMPGGPRVVIDETTGETTQEVVNLPAPSQLILSPDQRRAIVPQTVRDTTEGGVTETTGEILSVYSLATNEAVPLYVVPSGVTLTSGCYENAAPCNYEIAWTDDHHVTLRPIRLDEHGNRIGHAPPEGGMIVYEYADPVTLFVP